MSGEAHPFLRLIAEAALLSDEPGPPERRFVPRVGFRECSTPSPRARRLAELASRLSDIEDGDGAASAFLALDPFPFAEAHAALDAARLTLSR